MNEDFLHFIWKFRMQGQRYRSVAGEEILILKPGEQNHDAGPDFINAQLKIGFTLWAGNVEIHVRASDWIRHRHNVDEAYDNVILHVVFENDLVIRRKNGEEIPALILKDLIHPGLYETYNYFLNNHLWIPCAFRLPEVPDIAVKDWLAALSIERLERKSDALKALLLYNGYDWNQAFFESLATTLGFKINKEPFELLARQTPLHCIEKHKDELFQVEALLFGQAGLLDRKYNGDYPRRLRKEYQHLSHKFGLQKVPGHLWKFMRLRPNNFPTIRLAQLAMLLHRKSHFFGEILETPGYKALHDFFSAGVSDYWKVHYYFDRPSRGTGKRMSSATIDLILINNVIPFLFLYGREKGQVQYNDRALDMLESILPENNAIIRKFASFGIKAESAGHSQALLELKSCYCDQKKCLECRIGLDLIR